MPFAFLSDQHLAQYGQFSSDPSAEQLVDCFRLSNTDFGLLHPKTEPPNRLGLAIQLGTLRFLGTFLSDPTDVPKVVVRYVADQLGISDLRILRAYADPSRRRTRFAHAKVIREHLGYKEFDALEVLHLRRFLYAKLLVADERPIRLFDECTQKLVNRKVVLPGATTLARLVVEVRERVSTRLYLNLAKRLSEEHKQRLSDLLVPPEVGKGRKTPFDRLRTPPTRVSSSALIAALERVEAIRAVGVSNINLDDLPQSRLSGLAKYASVAWAQQLAKLNRERCHATMLAYMQHLERSASDDALDIFDALMSSLDLKSQRKWRKERLRNLKDLDSSALLMRDVVRVLYDLEVPDIEVRKTAFARFSKAIVSEADSRITELASPEGEEEPQAWQNATNVIGKFIVKLLTTFEFEATPNGKSLLEAMKWLVSSSRKISDKDSLDKNSQIPRGFVPQRWLSTVFPQGELHRPAYMVCLGMQLQKSLKHREVFVTRSHRYGDPRARLLQGQEWEANRRDVCRSLGLSTQAKVEIEKLADQLDAAYKRVLDLVEADETIELEEIDGILTPVVAPIEALPDSPTFNSLDVNIASRLPEIDLSELLLEVNARVAALPLSLEATPPSHRVLRCHALGQ